VRQPVVDAFRPIVWLGARLYFRIRFQGVQHIPRSGPLLIVSNHVTYADPVLTTIPVRRRVYYMAWNALFRIRGLAWLIRRLRAFPVDIDAADAGATRTAVRLLNAGEAVMIFPEAGRSPDGSVQRFRLGAFRLACSLGVPIMPVTIIGGHESWPPARRLPRPGRLTIIYHPIITPPADVDVKSAARDLAHRVQAVVASALPGHQRPDTLHDAPA
jgi:1-acyl-sn-glycerol-3-phosphate acyltransferase